MSAKKKTPFRKFRHFHFAELENLIPSVTLMVEESHDEPKAWFVSWAVCQPEDQFSRKTGREIAVSTWEDRGYTVLLDHDWDDPMEAAVIFLMTSRSISRDRNVQIVREALRNYITVEEQEQLNSYYKVLAIAHEKTGVLIRAIENLANMMAR